MAEPNASVSLDKSPVCLSMSNESKIHSKIFQNMFLRVMICVAQLSSQSVEGFSDQARPVPNFDTSIHKESHDKIKHTISR